MQKKAAISAASVIPLAIGLASFSATSHRGTEETLEGLWSPKRLVILEFASMEQAKA
jgi:uncharacterized protein (DUF1330 family)